MIKIPEYTATPKPPRTILKFARFGYQVELFFAWFDFWIGVFYDRKKKTVYLALLPTLIFSFRKPRPVQFAQINIHRASYSQNPADLKSLDEYIKNNPQFLEKMKKDMQRIFDRENQRIWCAAMNLPTRMATRPFTAKQTAKHFVRSTRKTNDFFTS